MREESAHVVIEVLTHAVESGHVVVEANDGAAVLVLIGPHWLDLKRQKAYLKTTRKKKKNAKICFILQNLITSFIYFAYLFRLLKQKKMNLETI